MFPLGKDFRTKKKRETNSLINDDTILRRAGARPFPLGLIFPRPTFFFSNETPAQQRTGGMKPFLAYIKSYLGPWIGKFCCYLYPGFLVGGFFQSIFRNLVHRGWGRKAFTQARGREVGKGLFFFFFFFFGQREKKRKKKKRGINIMLITFTFIKKLSLPILIFFFLFFTYVGKAGCGVWGNIFFFFFCIKIYKLIELEWEE